MKTNYKRAFRAALEMSLKIPVLLLMVLVTFASCRSDDNDDREEPQNPLIGFWQPYRLSQSATLSSGPYSTSTEYSVCQQKGRILFNEDGTGNAKTYTDASGACVMQDDSNFQYTYDAKTNALVITNAGGNAQNGSVKTLTESALVYEIVDRYDFQGEQNVLVTTTITARKTKD